MKACLSLLGLPEAPGVSLRDCTGNSSVLSWKPPCHTFLFCTTSPSVFSNSTHSQACHYSPLHSLLACSCDTLLSNDERPATGVKYIRLERDRIPSNFLISLYMLYNLCLKTLLFKSISATHVPNKKMFGKKTTTEKEKIKCKIQPAT